MFDDKIINEDSITEFLDQDLKGLEDLLKSEDMNIDTTPEPLNLSSKCEESSYKICKCGTILYKNHTSQYRCGSCGSIIYDKREAIL